MKRMKTIEPTDRLFGEITPPGDKSISHRAIMAGSLAKGKTKVKGILECDDCNCTIRAFQDMGIVIKDYKGFKVMEGKGLKGLTRPKAPIHVGNSGTSMRILAGILAGQDFETTLKGDASLSRRPMRRIVEPLTIMDVDIRCRNGEYPPIVINGGPVKPLLYKMSVPSAQVKSAILFAGLFAKGVTKVKENFRSRDHTERMLRYFGADLKVDGLTVSVKGLKELSPRTLEIPGDISSVSFFMVGSVLLRGSKVMIKRVGINPTRAGILDILSRMGAKIKILNKKEGFEPTADILVEHSETHGITIGEGSIPSIIDELPIIFILASLSKGRTVVKGAGELRVKETDRISSMKYNLEKMGARITLKGDDIIIDDVRELRGARLKSFGDHRTCMSMAIAALAAKGRSTIDDTSCVSKSFPEFFELLERLRK